MFLEIKVTIPMKDDSCDPFSDACHRQGVCAARCNSDSRSRTCWVSRASIAIALSWEVWRLVLVACLVAWSLGCMNGTVHRMSGVWIWQVLQWPQDSYFSPRNCQAPLFRCLVAWSLGRLLAQVPGRAPRNNNNDNYYYYDNNNNSSSNDSDNSNNSNNS